VEDAASHCHRIVGFCMLLGLGAHAASATPAPKGCPAEPSGWVEVSYVTSPTEDWTKTSLYTFLFEDTTIGQLAIDELGFSSQEDVYFFIVLHDFEGVPFDRNGDNGLRRLDRRPGARLARLGVLPE
jgi:hypothetical protein